MTANWKNNRDRLEKPTFESKTTTLNTYANVAVTSADSVTFWNTEGLHTKVLRFTATTNNLLVKILGSLDSAGTFPDTVEAEFAVNVGTPVRKTIANYYDALRVQVKPAADNVHGTLAVQARGSTGTDPTDTEITVGDVDANLQVGDVDVGAANPVPVSMSASMATTIAVENVTLTVVDTEYSYTIPNNCKSIEFWSRNGYPVRFEFTTGHVATPTGDYLTLKSNNTYASPPSLNLSSKTVYFASDNAGDIVEILAWS